MKKIASLFVFAMVVFAFSVRETKAQQAAADPSVQPQPCDISRFKDFIAYKNDDVTTLAFFARASQQQTSANQSGGSASLADLLSLGGSTSSSVASQAEKLLQLNYSQANHHWLLVSALTSEGQAAYEACLKDVAHAPLSAILSEGAAHEKQFFVTIYSHPSDVGDDYRPLTIKILGGHTLEQPPPKMRRGASATILVERESFEKSVQISVSIGYDNLQPTILLPPLPTRRLVITQQCTQHYSKLREYHGSPIDRRLCVRIREGDYYSMLVPKSLKFSADIWQSTLGSIKEAGKPPETSDPTVEQCLYAETFTTQEGFIEGIAYATATVLKSVPIDEAKSNVGAAKCDVLTDEK